MTKKLLLSLAISSIMLSGCGQDIEKIEADLNAKSGAQVEYELKGYVAIAEKKDIDEMAAFIKAHQLEANVSINSELALEALPDLDFTPDEFDNIEDIHEKIGERLKEFDGEVKEEMKAILQKYKEEEGKYAREKESLNAQLTKYKSHFADEQAAFDKSQAIYDGFISTQKETEKKFDIAMRQVIIDEGLPIDVNTNFDLKDLYRDRRDTEGCVHETTAQIALKSGGCVYVAANVKTPSAQKIVLENAVVYEEASRDAYAYRDTLRDAKKALKNAQIVAKNRTGVDARKVEYAIKQAEKNASRVKKEGERLANSERLLTELARNDEKLRTLRNAYSQAVYAYSRALKREATTMLDVEVETFSDEDDTYSLSEDERGVVFFVLESEGRDPIIRMGKLSAKSDKSFYQVFKGSKGMSGNIEINDENDVKDFISNRIAGA